MTVGDAPTVGVPLTLDWEIQERNTFPLDFFEQFRPQRRDKDGLRITPQSRERVLLKNGCTVDEIQKGSERASQLRKQRIHTVRGIQVLQQIEQSNSSNSSIKDIPGPPSIMESP
jgi:hypothetical protein